MDPRDSVLKAPEPQSATCMREKELDPTPETRHIQKYTTKYIHHHHLTSGHLQVWGCTSVLHLVAPCGVTYLIPAEPYLIVALKNKTYLYNWYMHQYTLTPGQPQVWGCRKENSQTQLGSQQQRKCLKNTWKNTWKNAWKKRRGTHHHTSVVHHVAPCDTLWHPVVHPMVLPI